MLTIFDLITDNTSRQRYALFMLFQDNPHKRFTRIEVLHEVTRDKYLSILTKGKLEKENTIHPFLTHKSENNIPTILRDRLNELVKENILTQSKIHNEITYKFNTNAISDKLDLYKIPKNRSAEIESWIPSLEKYKELPLAKIIEQLAIRSKKTLGQNDHIDQQQITIIDFETPFIEDKRLMDLIEEYHYYIIDCTLIKKLVYEGHYLPNRKPEEKIIRDFMPYVLKESNGQWYVTGKCKESEDFLHIPMNRIDSKKSKTYGDMRTFVRENFSSEEYWDGCSGITRYGSPINISFKVKNGLVYNNIDYINIIPLVKNHQKVSVTGNWMKVKLEGIYLGPELIRKIRSFGRNNIKDIKPKWLNVDLWEEETRKTVVLSIKISDESIAQWTRNAERNLEIIKEGENRCAELKIITSPENPEWKNITISNILINSKFFYFYITQKKNLGENNIKLLNKSLLN